MSMFKDAFTWYAGGAIAYPQLHEKIIELTMPSIKLKNLLPEMKLRQGKTATFVKEKGSRSAAISETAEGAVYLFDYTPLTYVTVTPYKVGIAQRVTRETLEDLYIEVVESQLRRLARRMAYTIDADVNTVLSNGATNSVSATGRTIYMDGTSQDIIGTIGVNDITQAIATIQGYSLEPDSVAMHTLNFNDLQRLPQFASQNFYGSPAYATGELPRAFGLDFVVTPVVTAGQAYVLSTGRNPSAAYAPTGFFVVKRPLSVDMEQDKKRDSYDVIISTRYSPVVTYGDSIYKIIGLRSS